MPALLAWEAKYHYNFWRPQPAIINGDFDSNDATVGNGTWQPFVLTPPHPEYPSGHTVNSSAMAKILIAEFDDTPGVPIVVTLSRITRQWSSLSEAVQEVIDVRVYSGIHFPTGQVEARMGVRSQFVSEIRCEIEIDAFDPETGPHSPRPPHIKCRVMIVDPHVSETCQRARLALDHWM